MPTKPLFPASRPMIRVFILLATGILLAIYVGTSIQLFLFYMILLLMWWFRRRSNSSMHKGYLEGIGFSILIMSFGIILVNLHDDHHHEDYFSRFLDQSSFFEIRLLETPDLRRTSRKAEVEVIGLWNGVERIDLKGKAIVYIDSGTEIELESFKTYLIPDKFKEVAAPYNPHQFNYKRYLSFKGIRQQAYIRSAEIVELPYSRSRNIRRVSHDLQSRLLSILKELIPDPQENAVASALILGYKNDLDPELKKAYAGSGAMHVLAVSGLHVGLIYVLIMNILAPLRRIRKLQPFVLIFALIVLWAYALITGLSPSVQRATTMFGFIMAVQLLRRGSDMYNTLAGSAVFLLVIDPFMITEVGFQLSFLAVFGIVFFHSRIHPLFKSRVWLVNKIWTLCSISISAQITTAPLSILYFHQFPNYFIIANLLVIPLVTLILYLGMATLVLSSVPILNSLFAYLLSKLISLINAITAVVESIPGALSEGISIDLIDAWLLYCILLSIVLLIIYNRKRFIYPIVVLLSVLLIKSEIKDIDNRSSASFTAYYIPGYLGFEFRFGDQVEFFGDSGLINDENRMLFHVYNNWWYHSVNDLDPFLIKDGNFLFEIRENGQLLKTIGLMDKYDASFPATDHLLIYGDPFLPMRSLKTENLILNADNLFSKTRFWCKSADSLDLSYWNIMSDGAYELKLE